LLLLFTQTSPMLFWHVTVTLLFSVLCSSAIDVAPQGYWLGMKVKDTPSKDNKGQTIVIQGGEIVSASPDVLASKIEKDPMALVDTYWKQSSNSYPGGAPHTGGPTTYNRIEIIAWSPDTQSYAIKFSPTPNGESYGSKASWKNARSLKLGVMFKKKK